MCNQQATPESTGRYLQFRYKMMGCSFLIPPIRGFPFFGYGLPFAGGTGPDTQCITKSYVHMR